MSFEVPKSEIIGVIYELLPGFIAAWIFFALTAHPSKTPFERTIHALIYTCIVKSILILIQSFCFWYGKTFCSFGVWDTNTSFLVSVTIAVAVGLSATFIANSNCLHQKLLRPFSRRTSYPSEWYSAFSRTEPGYVYLHLKGSRRIRGWAEEWPDSATTGHFVLMEAAWVTEKNIRFPLLITERILIPVTEVELVEMELPENKWEHNPEEQAKLEKDMVEYVKERIDEIRKSKKSDPTDKQSDGGEISDTLQQRSTTESTESSD